MEPLTDLPNQIQADERIFISGQIGLVPSSLSVPSPQSLATEIPLVSQHSDRIVKALSSSHGAGGGWEASHPQMILYWVTEERHIPYSISAAQRLDVSPTQKFNLMLGVPHHQTCPRKRKEGNKNNVFFFCFLIARCHADALLGCEGSPQRRPHREASSLSYRSWIFRRR